MKSVVIGAGFSVGGAAPGSRQGPGIYRHSPIRYREQARDGGLVWQVRGQTRAWPDGLPELRQSCLRLARRAERLRHAALPVVIGGDHSCAIGTWSGLSRFGRHPLGLLWIDAHLDSHTPATSPSLRLHGMPLAVLLGEGDPALQLCRGPAVLPAYCAVVGVRSYEPGEVERLNRRGVRYYTMEEIDRRGLRTCLHEAWRRVSRAPDGFGLSVDLDALDPGFAPGVSVPAPSGLWLPNLLSALRPLNRKGLKGLEIVEFNPGLDHEKRTQRALTQLLNTLLR